MTDSKSTYIRRLFLQWFVSSLGLWIAAGLLRGRIDYQSEFWVVVVAGFALALVNMFIKPFVVLLSLPAILFSLGLFMIVINGLMVLLVSWLYEPFNVTGLWAAMLAGMVIGLVNYLVVTILEEHKS